MFPVQREWGSACSHSISCNVHSLLWCSITASSPALRTAREANLVQCHTAWATGSCRSLRKLPWDWFTPAWQMLAQTGISHTASCCSFPGGFQPVFSCLFYDWVRGQLRTELVLSFQLHVCSKGCTQVTRLSANHLYLKVILLAPAFLIPKNRLEVKDTYLLPNLMTSVKSVKQ